MKIHISLSTRRPAPVVTPTARQQSKQTRLHAKYTKAQEKLDTYVGLLEKIKSWKAIKPLGAPPTTLAAAIKKYGNTGTGLRPLIKAARQAVADALKELKQYEKEQRLPSIIPVKSTKPTQEAAKPSRQGSTTKRKGLPPNASSQKPKSYRTPSWLRRPVIPALTYTVNDIPLVVKVKKVRAGTKHESPVWDLLFTNKKENIEVRFPEFYTYHTGFDQNQNSGMQWYLTTTIFGGLGNGGGSSTPSTPNPRYNNFVEWAADMLKSDTDYHWKYHKEHVEIHDPDNKLGLKKVTR